MTNVLLLIGTSLDRTDGILHPLDYKVSSLSKRLSRLRNQASAVQNKAKHGRRFGFVLLVSYPPAILLSLLVLSDSSVLHDPTGKNSHYRFQCPSNRSCSYVGLKWFCDEFLAYLTDGRRLSYVLADVQSHSWMKSDHRSCSLLRHDEHAFQVGRTLRLAQLPYLSGSLGLAHITHAYSKHNSQNPAQAESYPVKILGERSVTAKRTMSANKPLCTKLTLLPIGCGSKLL